MPPLERSAETRSHHRGRHLPGRPGTVGKRQFIYLNGGRRVVWNGSRPHRPGITNQFTAGLSSITTPAPRSVRHDKTCRSQAIGAHPISTTVALLIAQADMVNNGRAD
jgi:hypothetical protein